MQKEVSRLGPPDENVDNESWNQSDDDSDNDIPCAQRPIATPTSGSRKIGTVSCFDSSQSEGAYHFFESKADKIPFNFKDSQQSIVEKENYFNFSQHGASQHSQRSQSCSQMSPTFSRSDIPDSDEYYGSQIGTSPNDWEGFPEDHYRCVPKYLKNIIRQWRKEEMQFDTKTLFDNQKEITERTRAIVIDWLLHQCSYLKVPSRALFLACRIFDKMISVEPFDTDSAFLTAMVCLSLSAKVENTLYPGANKYVRILNDENIECTENDFTEREIKILSFLNFNMTYTTQIQFLKLFMNVVQADFRTSQCVMFVASCSLLSSELAMERSELVALSVLAIALNACEVSMDVLNEEFNLFGFKKIESIIEKILATIRGVLDDRESLIQAHFNSMSYQPTNIQYTMPKFKSE